MLESSTSMNMTGLTHPRPRTSESEGLLSQSSSASQIDIMAENEPNQHGNGGNLWGTYLQRMWQQTGQKRLPAALAVLLLVMVVLSLPGAPGLHRKDVHHNSLGTDMATADATIREGTYSVGEALPFNQTQSRTPPGGSKHSSTRSSLPASNSTGEGPYVDSLGAVAANDSAPAPEPMVCPALVVPDDYFPDGEPPRTGSAEAHIVRSPRSLEKPQNERVLILAANSGGSCQLQLGDYYNFLSLLDKLQYGNVHGYDVMLGMGNVDDDLRKTWNKVAWMLKALNETSREDAEWILWMDLDTVAVESNIAFPLADYEGKDLVLWIQPDLVLEGDAFQLNTGVMLMRNTEWSKQFISDVARLGRMHVNHWQLMDEVFQEELTTPRHEFDSGLFDQNAMAYLMKRYQASVMPHVFAADKVFRINAFWRDYLGFDFSRLHEVDDSILFNHFSGCSMCAGKDNNEDLTLCESEFQRTFELANCTYVQMNQTSSPSYIQQVRGMLSQLPFCRHKPTPTQCLQYMDADKYDQTRMPQVSHRHMLSHWV